MADVELLVEVRQLAAGVLQEELAIQGVSSGKDVQKDRGGVEEYVG